MYLSLAINEGKIALCYVSFFGSAYLYMRNWVHFLSFYFMESNNKSQLVDAMEKGINLRKHVKII